MSELSGGYNPNESKGSLNRELVLVKPKGYGDWYKELLGQRDSIERARIAREWNEKAEKMGWPEMTDDKDQKIKLDPKRLVHDLMMGELAGGQGEISAVFGKGWVVEQRLQGYMNKAIEDIREKEKKTWSKSEGQVAWKLAKDKTDEKIERLSRLKQDWAGYGEAMVDLLERQKQGSVEGVEVESIPFFVTLTDKDVADVKSKLNSATGKTRGASSNSQKTDRGTKGPDSDDAGTTGASSRKGKDGGGASARDGGFKDNKDKNNDPRDTPGYRPRVEVSQKGGEVLIDEPRSPAELAMWAREYMMRTIYDGVTQYASATMEARMREYLTPGLMVRYGHDQGAVDRFNEKFGGVIEKLVAEAGSVQRMTDMGDTMLKRAGTNKELESVAASVGGGELSVTEYRLKRFKDWAPVVVPEHLRRCFAGRSEVSMSKILDRNLEIYVGFLGEWAEDLGEIWRQGADDADDKIRHLRSQKGKGGEQIGPSQWKSEVTSCYKTAREKYESPTNPSGLVALERKYLDMLKIPTTNTGLVDGDFLKAATANLVRRFEGEFSNNKLFGEVVKKLKSGEDMRLMELFGGKNIFDDSTKTAEKRWMKGVVTALAGGENEAYDSLEDYSSLLALNMVVGLGESAVLNATEESGGYDGGALVHLANLDVRQITETITGAQIGPKVTVGRVRRVARSLLRETTLPMEGKDADIVTHIRSGKGFTNLDWGQLRGDPGTGWKISLFRGMAVYDVVTKAPEAVDFYKDMSVGALEGLTKPFNTAFEWFGKGKVRFTQDDSADRQAEEEMYKLRDLWGRKHLDQLGNVRNLEDLGRDQWSPWFTYALGNIVSHLPDNGMLPKELWPSAGIEPKANRNRDIAWNIREPKVEFGGLGVNQIEKPLVKYSIPALIENFLEARMLTFSEAELLCAVLREVEVVGKWEFTRNKLDFKYKPKRIN